MAYVTQGHGQDGCPCAYSQPQGNKRAGQEDEVEATAGSAPALAWAQPYC